MEINTLIFPSKIPINRRVVLALKKKETSFFFFKLIYLLAALRLYCCVQAFSSCGEHGLPSACSAQASRCNGFSCWEAWAPGGQAQ